MPRPEQKEHPTPQHKLQIDVNNPLTAETKRADELFFASFGSDRVEISYSPNPHFRQIGPERINIFYQTESKLTWWCLACPTLDDLQAALQDIKDYLIAEDFLIDTLSTKVHEVAKSHNGDVIDTSS